MFTVNLEEYSNQPWIFWIYLPSIGSTDSLLDIRSFPGEEERQTVRFQVLWGEIGAPVSGGISYITLPWEPKTLL